MLSKILYAVRQMAERVFVLFTSNRNDRSGSLTCFICRICTPSSSCVHFVFCLSVMSFIGRCTDSYKFPAACYCHTLTGSKILQLHLKSSNSCQESHYRKCSHSTIHLTAQRAHASAWFYVTPLTESFLIFPICHGLDR